MIEIVELLARCEETVSRIYRQFSDRYPAMKGFWTELSMEDIMKAVFLILVLSASLKAAVHRVSIVNFAFVPQTENVMPGDTVRWVNQSISPHTSTSGVNGVPDSIWNSGTITPGDSFDFAFNLAPAAYPYYCAFHWQGGMTGSIVVATGVEETGNPILGTAGLLRIRPNPFRNIARFYFEITEPRMNDILVYNTNGQTVKTLFSGFMAAGRHVIIWDAKGDSGRKLPAGTYFMIFRAGSHATVQKILLID